MHNMHKQERKWTLEGWEATGLTLTRNSCLSEFHIFSLENLLF